MRLKNYQEEVVLRAIEIALEDQPALRNDDQLVNDVAAYVLNRVPPKYIMSERGFLRLAAADLDDQLGGKQLLNIIELMILVNRGVDVVSTRRRREGSAARQIQNEPGSDFVHNFPQLIGRVVAAETGHPVNGATVTLYRDGSPVPPADSGWENPYVTHLSTNGYFSFWPEPFQSAQEDSVVVLRVTVEHPDYQLLSLEKTVETEGVFQRLEQIQSERIVNLGELRVAANREP